MYSVFSEGIDARVDISYRHLREDLRKSSSNFKLQRVYDPEKQILITLNNPETHELSPIYKTYDNWDFLEASFDADTAKKIAECELDQISLLPLK